MARRPGLKTIPIERVESILAAQRAGQHDLYAPLSQIRLGVASSLAPLPRRYQLTVTMSGEREQTLRLTPTSISQLCALAGVPVQFMEKLPAALGLKTLSCMLQMSGCASDRPMLLRLKGRRSPRLRAVLPQSFARFDDLQLMQQVRATAGGRDGKVAGLGVDDDYFFMRLVFGEPTNLGTATRPDPAYGGMDVISSETGLHPLQLRYSLFRVVCANGVTETSDSQESLRLRHTRIDRAALRAAVQATLERATTRGRDIAARLADSRGKTVRAPDEEIRQIFREHKLGSARGKLGRWVATELLKHGSLIVMKFDVVQAFTAVARGLEHRDRMRFEDAMGAYLMAG